MTALLRYDAACRAIAEAKTIDEVKTWIDKAAAVREYTRRIKNRQMEIDAIEIRVRAKRRRGELLFQLKAEGRLTEGRKKTVIGNGQLEPITLEELEVSRNDSAEDQEIAKIDGDSFERLVARCRAYTEEHPERHSFNVLKPPPEGGINGARSIMGSRQEPDDSLDYFPTPPWATRALIEYVLPEIGVTGRQLNSVWEPACGEGHISEVVKEYGVKVYATDIFDYGRAQDRLCDFLFGDYAPHVKKNPYDWIITNPPFGDEAIKFVQVGLDQAKVGVAMFFRSQWAVEGVERYETIFRDHPPTMCAFFVERVNLCKGRWDPDGTTATAYCWLVWKKNEAPRPTFWIPPGCHKSLTMPDDREKFAAWSIGALPETPHDPDTGEIIAPPITIGERQRPESEIVSQ